MIHAAAEAADTAIVRKSCVCCLLLDLPLFVNVKAAARSVVLFA